MRRRRAGGGRTLTAQELVDAVTAAGLAEAIPERTDELRALLDELGGYSVLHWLRAEMIVRTGHRPVAPGWTWDDGRPPRSISTHG